MARASLEELRLDYEDFLRQRALSQWPPNHPALLRFKAKRCATLEEIKAWVEDERRRPSVRVGPCQSVSVRVPPSSQLAANAALSLLNLACYFLDRQLAALEKSFLEEGGFTERLHRARTQSRRRTN